MKKLLQYIISGILASKDFKIDQTLEGDKTNLTIVTSGEFVGMIIGKEGKTIRAIRKIMSVKGTLEDKFVNVMVSQST